VFNQDLHSGSVIRHDRDGWMMRRRKGVWIVKKGIGGRWWEWKVRLLGHLQGLFYLPVLQNTRLEQSWRRWVVCWSKRSPRDKDACCSCLWFLLSPVWLVLILRSLVIVYLQAVVRYLLLSIYSWTTLFLLLASISWIRSSCIACCCSE